MILNILHALDDKRMFHKVGRSLAAAGHEIVSIGPQGAAPPPACEGMRFVRIPEAPSKRHRLISLARLVRLGLREQGDVYLAPEPESWVAALCVKILRGGRVVLDMHEHIPTEFAKFFPAFTRSAVEWATVRFMRLFARFTDHIILTRNSFETPWRGLKTPRTVVINTNHLQPACVAIPAPLTERLKDAPALIHQGLFGVERGSYQLLDAMKLMVAELPELRCIVIGDYAYGSEAEYRQAVEQAGLSQNFLFLGTVPFSDVPGYIAAAWAGLILFQPGPVNHTLAMPHKLFDYMREARPVIAPDFALEVAHIVQEADCGLLVDVTQPRAIANAALRLLQNPDEAQRLGENGRALVESKYNWREDEKRLLGVFSDWEAR